MLEVAKLILKYVSYFFIFYMLFYSTFLFISALVGSVRLFKNRYRDKMNNIIKHDYYNPVSIIVPAYNEENVILSCINSLLELNYRLYEIIIVDDGSTDNTLQTILNNYQLYKVNKPVNMQIKTKKIKAVYEGKINNITLTVVSKENSGKSDALNVGINISSFPYFLAMDADSILQKDSLEKMIQPVLEYENVIACGGFVRLNNGIDLKNNGNSLPDNLLACMQVLEYDRAFLASRILLDEYNGNLIISGAFGLFKKDLVIACGGYDTDTVGEDFELVVKLHIFAHQNNLPYRICYVPEAICWTQVPSSLSDLLKQRKRWYVGLIQVMWKYRILFCNYHYGFLSFVSYFYYLLFELFSPFIEVLGIIVTIMAMCFGLINIPFMIIFLILYTLFGCILSLTTFFARVHIVNNKISFSDILKAFLVCLFEISILRFILMVGRLVTVFTYRNNKMRWDKLNRIRTSDE